jgi:hypothetical protein
MRRCGDRIRRFVDGNKQQINEIWITYYRDSMRSIAAVLTANGDDHLRAYMRHMITLPRTGDDLDTQRSVLSLCAVAFENLKLAWATRRTGKFEGKNRKECRHCLYCCRRSRGSEKKGIVVRPDVYECSWLAELTVPHSSG